MTKSKAEPFFFYGTIMIGKILRDIRLFNKMNLTDLSAELKVSQGYLSEIELGKKDATLEIIQKYSEKFNVPVSAILFFYENKQEPNLIRNFRKIVGNSVSQLFDFLLLRNT